MRRVAAAVELHGELPEGASREAGQTIKNAALCESWRCRHASLFLEFRMQKELWGQSCYF